MPFELRTEIVIDASADRVWSTLTDFARFPEWNPFVRAIEVDGALAVDGAIAVGARLAIQLTTPAGKKMKFSPRVITLEPARHFAWLGRVLIPGLFDGEHHFELEPIDAGTTRFVHSERFSGVLVPLFRRSLDTDTRAGFEAMNRALKPAWSRLPDFSWVLPSRHPA